MNFQEVKNRVGKSFNESIDNLFEFQGELKSLDKKSYEKFKNQILENGFTSPFHVWRDDKNKLHILDGHQRLRTLKMMQQDGVHLPSELTCIEILADDKKHAKKILLGLAAVYGKITDESLSDFAIDAEIDLDWITENIELPFDSSLTKLNEEIIDENINVENDSQYILSVHLNNENELQKIFEELNSRGYACKIIT